MEIKDLNLSSHSQYWEELKGWGTKVIQKDKNGKGIKECLIPKELFMSFKTKDKFHEFLKDYFK